MTAQKAHAPGNRSGLHFTTTGKNKLFKWKGIKKSFEEKFEALNRKVDLLMRISDLEGKKINALNAGLKTLMPGLMEVHNKLEDANRGD